MANFLTRMFGTSDLVESLREREYEDMRLESMATQMTNEALQESMTELMRFMEDRNWMPLEGFEHDNGFTLEAIKENAGHLEALLAINPTVQKGINARIGYIWGRGVKFDKAPKTFIDNPQNSRVLFDDSAHPALEMQLATAGNIWAVRDKQTDEIHLQPLAHINGWITDENDPTRVNYWLIQYTRLIKNFATGNVQPKEVKEFYPAYGYKPKVASIDGIKINKNVEVIHLAANRQASWVLGAPDLLSVMFWTKALKELYESGTTFVKAQGKFASKVVNSSKNGATNTAARLADAPRRDPNSGEIMDVGGTAVMSGSLDYQLMGKMTGGVDFTAFDSVAGLVAAGLDVPVDVLLAKSDTELKTLEQSVVNTMQMRQKLWTWFFKAVFGARKVEISWPKIRTEPEYRRIQAVGIANDAHVLQRHELRQLTLEGFDLDGDINDLPDMELHPKVLIAKATAENQEEITPTETLPSQGVDGEVGKLSTGGDAKASRDNKLDTNTKNS